PADTIYPDPLWRYAPISERLLLEVIAKMKPWKATRSHTFPNCVYKFGAKLLAPRLARIYRALDTHAHEPEDWKQTETIVARKPGKPHWKPDYSQLGAHRPLILSHGHMRIRNTAKNAQVAANTEKYNMLPANHWGG
ncbi:hypothetical protein K438DRAFT_1443910, partial [Mycena galopus ATCC 62051]